MGKTFKHSKSLFPRMSRKSAIYASDLNISKHPARVGRDIRLTSNLLPFDYVSVQKEDGLHHISTSGAHLIKGDDCILVKLPYGLSSNAIWRATIDSNTGKQRNSLSRNARNYKKNIETLYAPLLAAINFEKITQLCEIRLIVQPPKTNKIYSERTHPRYDIDNYPKLLIDSLKDHLFCDDNIFIKEQIQFAQPIEKGCVWLSCILKEQPNWLKTEVNFDWLSGRI